MLSRVAKADTEGGAHVRRPLLLSGGEGGKGEGGKGIELRDLPFLGQCGSAAFVRGALPMA